MMTTVVAVNKYHNNYCILKYNEKNNEQNITTMQQLLLITQTTQIKTKKL